jgi:hypothetical protein
VLTSWPGYCLVAASLIGLWLMESSFNAAPLHASLPAITAAEPLAGIALGIVVFGDVVRVSPGMIILQGAGLAATVAGRDHSGPRARAEQPAASPPDPRTPGSYRVPYHQSARSPPRD